MEDPLVAVSEARGEGIIYIWELFKKEDSEIHCVVSPCKIGKAIDSSQWKRKD
jgi:hypothetical protein